MLQLRQGKKSDSEQLITLIDTVYREYGDVVNLNGADSDLLDIESKYLGAGGNFVVLTDGSKIVGSHAVHPLDRVNGLCTFRRLYLYREYRGSGSGHLLMDWAIQWAKYAGLKRVEFWSDTRFTRAHRFFAQLGFQKTGEVRDMDDGAMPYSEYFFFRELN